MTLETAKRLVEEGHTDKEAEAVIRGGMNICELVSTLKGKFSNFVKIMDEIVDE